MGDRKEPHIAALVITCQTGIADLLLTVNLEDCCVKDFLRGIEIEQILERFAQWAGNIGALQNSKSPLSLEYRLRDAPLVRASIVNYLQDLNISTQDAIDIATGRRQNRIAVSSSVDVDAEHSEYDISSESDISSIPSSTGEKPLPPTSEIQELILAIKTGLDSLFKSSIFIRNFAPNDKRLRAAKTVVFDNRADITYINNRYPSLRCRNETLVTRLGEANARRRQYFKYCRDHNDRLSTPAFQDKTPASHEVSARETKSAKLILTEERKSSLFYETEATAFGAAAIAPSRLLDTDDPPAVSIVSFATSVASSSYEELVFPPVPTEEHRWRRHGLQDLEPYICTFSSCSLDSFHSQHAWFQHELSVHRTQWICSQCSTSFMSSEGLKTYIGRHHHTVISERQITTIVDQSKRPIDSIPPSECPFWDGLWARADTNLTTSDSVLVVDVHQFRRHVGYHLQQIALFALPRLTQNSDQNRSVEANLNSSYSDQDAASMHSQWVSSSNSRGWRVVLSKRATFIAFAYFVALYRTQGNSSNLKKELKYAGDDQMNLEKLASISTAACTCGHQERWQEAGELEKQALDMKSKLLGVEHSETLKSTDNMVVILRTLMKYKEAEELGTQILKTKERVLGTKHPDTIASMDNLAMVLGDLGKHQEAEGIYQQIMKSTESLFRSDHPNTMTIATRLALTYDNQGRFEEAEELQKETVEAKRKVLGPEHVNTLMSIQDLAGTLYSQKKYEEAEELQTQNVEIATNMCGSEHPDTLTNMDNLSKTLYNMGMYKEAEAILIQVVERRKRVLGGEHLDTVISKRSLAIIRNTLTQNGKASSNIHKILKRGSKLKVPEANDASESLKVGF